jgi:hypothetical protein
VSLLPSLIPLNLFPQHHRRFQTAFRKFVEEWMIPDAHAREEDGKRPSQKVFDEMARLNITAMRLGPGKHLEGRELMGGIVKPEEVGPLSLHYGHTLQLMSFIS